MLFNSVDFLIFFPLTTFVYFSLPHRFRWAWLLAASFYFYMVFIPVYALVLVFLIGVDYVLGIQVEKNTGRRRKLFLFFSIFSNLMILGVFKYYNFFNETVSAVARFFHLQYSAPFLNIILPIGLSFHTFQSMSYVIEVYRGNQKAERHLGIFALYVMFYPQLVAGPIERPGHLIPQFYERHSVDWNRMAEGFNRILWGLFKKAVIADRLALFVQPVFAAPASQDGWSLLLAAYFFAIQIYCDFSGYSDMAIGIARVLGFQLVENFDNPYSSQSVSEFWRRWHMSLSNWFRDYLYIPLGGNRCGWIRHAVNILIVFFLCGLWHGAHWTFVVWGLLNAVYLIAEFLAKQFLKMPLRWPEPFKKTLRILMTFHLTVIAWIFFRAASIAEAWDYLVRLAAWFFGRSFSDLAAFTGQYFHSQPSEFYIGLWAVLFLIISENSKGIFTKQRRPEISIAFSIFKYGFLIMFIMLAGVFEENRFIYFQF